MCAGFGRAISASLGLPVVFQDTASGSALQPQMASGSSSRSKHDPNGSHRGCHRTDHCRKLLFLLHRTQKSNCFESQRSQSAEPDHCCVTAPVTEGKCCLHRAHVWDRKIASEWSATTQGYTHTKPKELRNWGVLETLWAEPEGSWQLQHHSLLSSFWELCCLGWRICPKATQAGGWDSPGYAWAHLEGRKRDKTASCFI